MRNLKLVLALVATLIASVCPAPAQNSLRQIPLGFCSLASMASSTALSTCSGGIPARTSYALLCAYVSGVVYRDDGVVPTGTPGSGGQGIAPGQCVGYSATFSKLLFIQQAAGALLGVSFYQ